MRRVALFSTHCDTEEKEKTLLENIRKVKELGLDTFVLTVIPLSDEVIKEADYVIYSNENPVPDIEDKFVMSWKITKNGVKITSFLPDYGYASLLQLKRLIEFSSCLNYDYYFTMIYDIIITPEVEKVLLEGRECSFFKNPNVASEFGGILTAFNRNNAKKFASLISYESYFEKEVFNAEEWLIASNNFICAKVEEIYVGDSISLHDTFLVTNNSPFKDFSFFIVKDHDVKLFFYDLQKPIKLSIETNINNLELFLDDQKLVYIHDRPEDIKYLRVTYDGVEKDITKDFDIIIKNSIEGYKDLVVNSF
jgi:hypothetical protein